MTRFVGRIIQFQTGRFARAGTTAGPTHSGNRERSTRNQFCPIHVCHVSFVCSIKYSNFAVARFSRSACPCLSSNGNGQKHATSTVISSVFFLQPTLSSPPTERFMRYSASRESSGVRCTFYNEIAHQHSFFPLLQFFPSFNSCHMLGAQTFNSIRRHRSVAGEWAGEKSAKLVMIRIFGSSFDRS